MRGAPEPYLPGRPSSPDDEPAEEGSWPPRIYVPGPASGHEALPEEVRRRLRAIVGDRPDPAEGEAHARAVLGPPGLRDAVLGRLEAAARERGADRVAGLGPGGWLLAAVLADRMGLPFMAITAPGTGEGAGQDPVAAEGDRVLVLVPVAGEEGLDTAIRALESDGAEVAGVAALARAASDKLDDDHLNYMFVL